MDAEAQGIRDGGLVQGDELVRVGNLGIFSMKLIYEALSNTMLQGTDGATIPTAEEKGDESDCSWTAEEEHGEFYIQMRRRLDDFLLSPIDTDMTTDPLSRNERRFVHATAQAMRLGHTSLGPSRRKDKRVYIYKTPGSTTPEVTQDAQSKSISWGCFEYLDFSPTMPELQAQAAPASTLNSLTDLASSSLLSSVSQRKRKRLEKLNGGYPCQFHPCGKVFDRASERNKHEQAHQPAFTNRYQCNICNKGFRYPKDLRRHNTRVHESGASRAIFDPTYASLGSTTFSSSLTYDSRLPSETSLTFNSKPVSKNSSPLLLGQGKGPEAAQLGIEEFWLERDADTLPSLFPGEHLPFVEDSHLPFQYPGEFEFDDHDLADEDGLLEMAKAKR